MSPDKAKAERKLGELKRCPGGRNFACFEQGTSRRRWSLRCVTALLRTSRELWIGYGRRDRGGARAKTRRASAPCYDALNRGRNLSGDARRRGGIWRPRENPDQVGRCGP